MQTPPCYPECSYCPPGAAMSHSYEIEIKATDKDGRTASRHVEYTQADIATPEQAAEGIENILRYARTAGSGEIRAVKSDG
jgi:hypothetical protein